MASTTHRWEDRVGEGVSRWGEGEREGRRERRDGGRYGKGEDARGEGYTIIHSLYIISVSIGFSMTQPRATQISMLSLGVRKRS